MTGSCRRIRSRPCSDSPTAVPTPISSTRQAHNVILSKFHFQLFGEDRCVYLAHRFMEVHLMTEPGRVDKSWIHKEDDGGERGPFSYMGHFQELEEHGASFLLAD